VLDANPEEPNAASHRSSDPRCMLHAVEFWAYAKHEPQEKKCGYKGR